MPDTAAALALECRATVEPRSGHLKNEHRLERNRCGAHTGAFSWPAMIQIGHMASIGTASRGAKRNLFLLVPDLLRVDSRHGKQLLQVLECALLLAVMHNRIRL